MAHKRINLVLTEEQYEELIYMSSLMLEGTSEGSEIHDMLLSATDVEPFPFRYNTVTFDFDGVCVRLSEDHEPEDSKFGSIIPGVDKAIKLFKDHGYRVGILTARPDSDADGIRAHLLSNGIEVDFIQEPDDAPYPTHKPLSDLYIDDRAWFFQGNWDKTDLVSLERWLKGTGANCEKKGTAV